MSFVEDAASTAGLLQAFAERAQRRDGPVLVQPPIAQLSNDLGLDQLIAEGGLEGARLRQFLDTYLAASTRLHHPRYMAHQVAVPIAQGALAGLIDSFTNNAMAIYEMGPAAAAVEQAVVRWMLMKIGWRAADKATPQGAGVLTHGGSLANLTALLAARARVDPHAWEHGPRKNLAIVCTAGAHYSIMRAAAVMGLGARSVRHAPADALGRLDADALPGFIAGLRAEGIEPMAMIANACSTALGLYDSIDAIAAVCRKERIWLHIDGAHGASALLSPRLRGLLKGIEAADTVVWDAHKMLRSPVLCGAVLTRDPAALDGAFAEEASYLFHDKDQPGIDVIHRTIECTKAGLGLKIFFALAHAGEQAIAATIERQTDLATQAAAYLREVPNIEVAAEPQSNIVCFRLKGSDPLQIEIRRRLTSSGAFYISTTEALGQRWLRLALMNPGTTLADIEALAAEVVAVGRAVQRNC